MRLESYRNNSNLKPEQKKVADALCLLRMPNTTYNEPITLYDRLNKRLFVKRFDVWDTENLQGYECDGYVHQSNKQSLRDKRLNEIAVENGFKSPIRLDSELVLQLDIAMLALLLKAKLEGQTVEVVSKC